mmetsp:Transcript_13200/g.40582  ORF Transcript_13200/g.40582 Transcript_13200/m.40582 type:complete len:162 (+) Transcript_13200:103-588(+)
MGARERRNLFILLKQTLAQHAVNGRKMEALKVWNRIRCNRVRPDVTVYNSLILAHINSNDKQGAIKFAKELRGTYLVEDDVTKVLMVKLGREDEPALGTQDEEMALYSFGHKFNAFNAALQAEPRRNILTPQQAQMRNAFQKNPMVKRRKVRKVTPRSKES